MAITASRREILRIGAAGAAALLVGSNGRRTSQAGAVGGAVPTGPPDVEFGLKATRGTAVLDAAGREGVVWRYQGQVLSGPAGALTTFPGSYLGPTIRVRRGKRVRIRFDNALAEPSIVHWHGLDVSEQNDGHPRFAVGPGRGFVYDFTVDQRPGTYWYHPHPDGRTGPQVYMGLAGLFIVEDPDDASMGLPIGAQDLALVLQDRVLDAGGALAYVPDPMLGMLGNRVFINGRASTTVDVKAGSYRLRILNGSNARIYKLAWSDASPITVLGTDGGLVAIPLVKPYVMLAPGERIEVWADFGRAPGGNEVWLESRSFYGGQSGMMGMGGIGTGSGTGTRVPNGAAFRVCRFVAKGTGSTLHLPPRLTPLQWRPDNEVTNRGNPRRFEVSMTRMRWLFDGRPFEMEAVAPDERVRLGTTEEWEFSNRAAMMALPHPIHLHGAQFQIVKRHTTPEWESAIDTVRKGLVDEGWKDTFLLMPGERVRIRVRFGHHAGLFLYHCHNLEHEDMGMMRNFLVMA